MLAAGLSPASAQSTIAVDGQQTRLSLGQGRPQQVAGHRPAARRPRHPGVQPGHRRRRDPHAAPHLRHRRRRRPVQRHHLRSGRPADRVAGAGGRAQFLDPVADARPPHSQFRHQGGDRQRQHRPDRLRQERRRFAQGRRTSPTSSPTAAPTRNRAPTSSRRSGRRLLRRQHLADHLSSRRRRPPSSTC